MKKAYPVILKYTILVAVLAFLMWLNFRDKDTRHNMAAAFDHAKYILLLPVFVLLLLSHYFRSLRWQQLIEPMGYHPPLFDLFCGLLVGYLTNQFIPRGGEVVRCTFVARQHKIPLEKLIGTIISERAVDVVCLLILGVSVFFFQYAFLSGSVLAKISSLRTGDNLHHWLIVFGVIAAICIVVYIIKKTNSRFSTFFVKIFKGFREGFGSIKNVRSKWKFVLYTLLMWTCYIFSTWIGCFAMLETAHLPFVSGIILLFAGTLGIIATPGGVFAYPYAIQKTLLLYGIHEDVGKAFGWLLWGAQFVFTVVFGTLAYIVINLRRRRYEKHIIRSA